MTKTREPLSFELALTRIAGVIGWTEVSTIVGRAERTVRKWSDHDVQVGIPLDAALKLDLAYQRAGETEAPLLQCYALRLKAEAIAAMPDAARFAELTATAAKELGEAMAALISAQRPGASPADRLIAKREVEEGIGALTRTLPMCDPMGGPDGSGACPGGQA